jgi:hypothetical protein
VFDYSVAGDGDARTRKLLDLKLRLAGVRSLVMEMELGENHIGNL